MQRETILSLTEEFRSIAEYSDRYDKLNFSVIPLRKHNKLHVIEWKVFQKRRANNPQQRAWFEKSQYNIGLIMGKVSNAFAIDIDGVNAVRRMEIKLVEMGYCNLRSSLINTFMTKTGAGGFHFILKPEPVPSKVIWRDEDIHSEIRLLGESRCIAAAPSVHPSGVPYIWNGKAPSLITKKEMRQFIELIGNSRKQITLDEAVSRPKTKAQSANASATWALTPEQMQGLLAVWQPRYKVGRRHDIVLGLSAAFFKEGVALESGERFIRLLCTKTHDEELDPRLNTLRITYSKDPSDVAGWSILDEFED
jgi:hypothetical protein